MNKKIIKLLLFIMIVSIIGYIIYINVKPNYAYEDDNDDKIHFIQTGASDAILIESNGHYGLIDTSNPAPTTTPGELRPNEADWTNSRANGIVVNNYLTSIMGENTLDFLILTHSHTDHLGGVPDIIPHVGSNTITIYKEYHTITPEENDNYLNQAFFDRAINSLTGHGSLCEISTITTLNSSNVISCISNNPNLSDVSFNIGTFTKYTTNLDDNISFTFGDYVINLYNLYHIYDERENVNSIVTLVTKGNKKILLNADAETTVAPDSGNNTLGMENQIADIVGKVNVLKAGHHGHSTSNSYYMFEALQPDSVILTTRYFTNESDTTTHYKVIYDQFHAAAAYLKQKGVALYETAYPGEAPNASLTDGAIILDVKSDGLTFNTDPLNYNTVYSDSSWLYNTINGWKKMNNLTRSNFTWVYIDTDNTIELGWKSISGNYYWFDSNGIMVKGWRAIKLASDDKYRLYYFGSSGVMSTTSMTVTMNLGSTPTNKTLSFNTSVGYMNSCNNEWLELDGAWYLCTSDGDGVVSQNEWKYSGSQWYYFGQDARMATGWVKVDGYWYYMTTEELKLVNNLPLGAMHKGWLILGNKRYYLRPAYEGNNPNGTMVTGWYTYEGNDYYFSESGAMVTGPKTIDNTEYYFYDKTNGKYQYGQLIRNVCVANDNGFEYCTDSNGIVISMNKYIAKPTANDFCNTGLIYNGTVQTLTKAPGEGYTFSGNQVTDAGIHQITASLQNNYRWDGNTTEDVTFNCEISKMDVNINLSSNGSLITLNNSATFSVNATAKGTYAVTIDNPNIATIQYNNGEIDAYTNMLVTVTPQALGEGTITVTFTPSDTTNYVSNITDTYDLTIDADYLQFDTNIIADSDNNVLSKLNSGIIGTNLINLIDTNGTIALFDHAHNPLALDTPLKTSDIITITLIDDTFEYTIAISGDVMADGSVDVDDALLVATHIIDGNYFIEPPYLAAADYNSDGVIKMNDVMKMLDDISE